MTNHPSVAVVMPVRNGEKFIEDALRSIQSQEISVSEIHVVNDGSTDRTLAIVERMRAADDRISVHDGPCKGPGPARNVAIRAAKADIISFLDCDDLWPAHKLELQIARMQAAPRVGVVSGFVQYFDKQIEDGLAPAKDSRTDEVFHAHLGATIYRRSVLDEVGLFDESFLYSEDVDLMLRVREAEVPFTILNAITLYYRRHDSSMTTTVTPHEKRDFSRALFNSMKRRKLAGRTEPLAAFADLVED